MNLYAAQPAGCYQRAFQAKRPLARFCGTEKLIPTTYDVGHYRPNVKGDALAEDVGRLFSDRKLTLTTAESCTGGLISSRLTDISGSSDYVIDNVVTYSNEAKMRNLGVSTAALLNKSVYSPEVAKEMAEGALVRSGADVAVAITGLAGSGAETRVGFKPAGLAYIGLASKTAPSVVKQVVLKKSLNRIQMKRVFSQHALFFLKAYVSDPASL